MKSFPLAHQNIYIHFSFFFRLLHSPKMKDAERVGNYLGLTGLLT